jgi:predicted HicB family RNase H-like nuclease
MKKDMMEYKGYFGAAHYSDDDQVFFGKLEYIRDLVSYEGVDVKSLQKAFKEAVDDYLAVCEKTGKEPERPFKGTFNIRIDPELHKRLVETATDQGITLNAYIKDVLQHAVTSDRV